MAQDATQRWNRTEGVLVARSGFDKPGADVFLRRVQSVMVARSYVLIDYDIHRDHLAEATLPPFELTVGDRDVPVVDNREVLVDRERGERRTQRAGPLGGADPTVVAPDPFVAREADERDVRLPAPLWLAHDIPEAPVLGAVTVTASAPGEGGHAHASCPSRTTGSIGTRTPRSAATSAARE